MIDKKSLFIGLLIGICICLAVVLFSESRAYATQTNPPVAKYQITTGTPDFTFNKVCAVCYVLDTTTGNVFAVRHQKSGFKWEPILSGPPR